MTINAVMILLFLCFVAVLIGGIPFGLLAGKLRGVDLRKAGSGNIGATNVLRVLGPAYGIPVLLLDTLKGAIPVLIAKGMPNLPGWSAVLVGLCAILGHNYSVYLRFRGGKGVATSLGVLFALSPLVAGGAVLVFALVTALSRYVSLGSLAGALAQALLFWIIPFSHPDEAPAYRLFGIAAALFVFLRHRGNIGRLLNGTENRLGRKPAKTNPATAEPSPQSRVSTAEE